MQNIKNTDAPHYSEAQECGHCGNKTPHLRVALFDQRVGEETDADGSYSYQEELRYELYVCPACEGVSLFRLEEIHFHPQQEWFASRIFPSPAGQHRGLPEEIEAGLRAANRVRGIDKNAYGVLLRRVLEMVCADRGASPKKVLHQQLKELAERGEIPDKLVVVAAGLRQLGNVGAHAALGSLTERDAEILAALGRAILDYVYTAPALAAEVERLFDDRKKANPEQSLEADEEELD